ncbi:MAG: aromatic amino acid DMT transporter YddG [Chitinophagaceae bacterium]|nr:aromatic amino acid DMT transporter YddG [Chitinophagaceae bacterium]
MTVQTKATAIGLSAIVLWSSTVGLIKEVSHYFGAAAGAALIYTVASIFLVFTLKWIPLSKFPRKYLIYGALLMVSYELCFALSIGYSQTNKQAIEVGMVNYLWPSLTMIATIIFITRKTNWLIVPGIIISVIGIVWVLSGEEGFSVSEMLINIRTNPLSYGLAFLGAVLWSAYSVVTVRIAKGVNGMTFFFMLVAVALWIQFLISGGENTMQFNASSITYLLLAAASMGLGYAAWNVGILHGNVTLLAGTSNFIPVLSSAISALLLATSLGRSFWQGAILVCVGSVLCQLAVKENFGKKLTT